MSYSESQIVRLEEFDDLVSLSKAGSDATKDIKAEFKLMVSQLVPILIEQILEESGELVDWLGLTAHSSSLFSKLVNAAAYGMAENKIEYNNLMGRYVLPVKISDIKEELVGELKCFKKLKYSKVRAIGSGVTAAIVIILMLIPSIHLLSGPWVWMLLGGSVIESVDSATDILNIEDTIIYAAVMNVLIMFYKDKPKIRTILLSENSRETIREICFRETLQYAKEF